MFKWLSKSNDNPAEAPPPFDFDAVQAAEIAVLFKHSQTCPVSWAARREVQRFSVSHPSVPVYTVTVQKERQISNQIADWTGIRHESPQIIVLRKGVVAYSASHEDVTIENLSDVIQPFPLST
jgi:bacillithiol system protein YtxJ